MSLRFAAAAQCRLPLPRDRNPRLTLGIRTLVRSISSPQLSLLIAAIPAVDEARSGVLMQVLGAVGSLLGPKLLLSSTPALPVLTHVAIHAPSPAIRSAAWTQLRALCVDGRTAAAPVGLAPAHYHASAGGAVPPHAPYAVTPADVPTAHLPALLHLLALWCLPLAFDSLHIECDVTPRGWWDETRGVGECARNRTASRPRKLAPAIIASLPVRLPQPKLRIYRH